MNEFATWQTIVEQLGRPQEKGERERDREKWVQPRMYPVLFFIPMLIWLQNVKRQVDKVTDPQHIRLKADKRGDVVCVSALSGHGLDEFCDAVQSKLKVY